MPKDTGLMHAEELVLKANSFNEFNSMQKQVLKSHWTEKNLIISSPTASGKTIIAELFALNSIINKKKKVIYTCPLRALAFEHFHDFKKKYSDLNIRATISTGDFDSGSGYLMNYDLIFTTYEKLESLLNHRAQWLSSVGALIVDEIHEIDSSRGPTIEIVATKLRILNPKLHLLGLSATIPNGKDLAEWLDAELIESDYRPIELEEGVYFDSEIRFKNRIESIAESNDAVKDLCIDVLEKKKQALVFCNTRKASAAAAKKLSREIQKYLNEKEKFELRKASEKALNILESPTEQCHEISRLIESGVCYHNAGLLQKQRELIEELFKKNYLKVITATSTLGAGLNLPAFRVILPQMFRYTSNGMEPISVREYKQASGRAGRPKYDSKGEAILVARSADDMDNLQEKYIDGSIEEVNSNLGSSSILRTILLGAISSEFIFDLQSCETFFGKTFYSHQLRGAGNLYAGKNAGNSFNGNAGNLFQENDSIPLLQEIQKLLLELEEMDFIELNEKRFTATKLGRRVSELFLDPLSAHKFIQKISSNEGYLKKKPLYYLYLLSGSSEMFPYLSVSKSMEAGTWEELQAMKDQLPINADIEMFSDESILNKFALANAFNEWINEKTEQHLMKDFNLAPGTLFNKLEVMDWLCYSLIELSLLLDKKELLPELTKLRKRLKHGVKEELINLTELRGIGRVRARKLFGARIDSIQKLKQASFMEIAGLIGSAAALSVKQQLKVEVSKEELRKAIPAEKKQKKLGEF